MIGYIYIHTSPSGKSYIGQTTQNPPEKRWGKDFKGYLDSHSHLIYNAVQKYGPENIKTEILWTIEEKSKDKLIEKLNKLEEMEIALRQTQTPNGYNIRSGGLRRKWIMPEETKRRISLANKGRKVPREIVEKVLKSRKEGIEKRGYYHSQKTREKMSKSHQGIHNSEETKRKISLKNKGRVFSEESKEHIRAGTKKAMAKPEYRFNYLDAIINKKHKKLSPKNMEEYEKLKKDLGR